MFGGKKQEAGGVGGKSLPTERVKAMSRMGVNERDIVKQLKAEGYSFSEIEAGMMQAVKEGIETPSMPNVAMQPSFPVARNFGSRRQEVVQREPEVPFAWPNLERPEELFPETAGEEVSPESAVEDLIENVASEKMGELSDHIAKLDGMTESLKTQLKNLDEKIVSKGVAEIPKEFEDKVENLEARIAGTERILKQILPMLTQNIEELKKLVDELKSKEQSELVKIPSGFSYDRSAPRGFAPRVPFSEATSAISLPIAEESDANSKNSRSEFSYDKLVKSPSEFSYDKNSKTAGAVSYNKEEVLQLNKEPEVSETFSEDDYHSISLPRYEEEFKKKKIAVGSI